MAPKSRKTAPPRSRAPLWLALGGLVFLIAAFAVWWSGISQSKASIEVHGAPRLKVNQETIDHGNVKLGVTIKDTIHVTNVGDQPLRFTETPYIDVKEGC